MNAGEVREFLKANLANDSFLEALSKDLDKMTNVLLKNKAFRDELLVCYRSSVDYRMLASALIEHGYTPSPAIMDGVLSLGYVAGDIAAQLLDKFPSFPITNTFLLKILNSHMEDLAFLIIKRKKEFHTPKFLEMIINCNFMDEELESIIKDDPSLVNLAIKRSEMDLIQISDSFFSHALHHLKQDLSINVEKACKRKLSAEEYKLLYECKTSSHNYYYGSNSKGIITKMGSIPWNEELESIGLGDYLKIDVINPPKTSVYWHCWIGRHPEDAEIEDLIEQANKEDVRNLAFKIHIYREIISKRGLEAVKKLDLDCLKRIVPPAYLRDMLKTSDVAKYLYENMGTKYKAQLRKKVDDDDLPAAKVVKNKKSFYTEVISAIYHKNADHMRELTSKDYTLEKFVSDTKQVTKRKAAESCYVSYEFLFKLTKEELFILAKSALKFSSYYYSSTDYGKGKSKSFKYTFSVDEIKALIGKMDYHVLFAFASDQIEAMKALSGWQIMKIASDDKYTKDPKLAIAIIDRLKMHNKDLDTLALVNLCKTFTKEELSGLTFEKSKWGNDSLINLKCKCGSYFVEDKELLSLFASTSLLENSNAVFQLRDRSTELAIKLCKAYLAGNKELSVLAAKEINHKRQSVKFYEKVALELEMSTEDICEKLFSEGADLETFKKSLVDWRASLIKADRDVTIKVKTITYDEIEFISKTKFIKLSAKILKLEAANGFTSLYIQTLPRLKFEKISIDGRYVQPSYGSNMLRDLSGHIDLTQYPLINDKEGDPTSSVRYALLKLGLRMANTGDMERDILNTFHRNGSQYTSVADMELLSQVGLIFSDENVYQILNSHMLQSQTIKWIAERLGDLKGFSFDGGIYRGSNSDFIRQELTKYGATVLGSHEYEILRIQEKIAAKGKDFDPIIVETWIRSRKAELIKFIEKDIDPNYAKLNLLAINLDDLKIISCYAALRDNVLVDDQDVTRIFCVPSSLTNNKKLFHSIREYCALHSGFTYKIALMKQVFSLLNPELEVTLADILDYSNHAAVTESESMQRIPLYALKAVLMNTEMIKGQSFILTNMDKTSIVRFLRSASEKDESYIKDIFDMISRVIKGVEALEGRKSAMVAEGADQVRITEISNSIESVMKRLAEVAAMDNVVHMHDRIVPLLAFIKSDPVQPLNQDKFSALEKNDQISVSMGLKLFFPKTRGDLQELGDTHGWCVNHHPTYGDNVINKGNILVAIVPGTEELEPSNVVALAHFIHKGNNDYYLEQLKWSKTKKNGQTNVDATSDFDHGAILSIIREHLSKIEKKAA